MATNYFQRVRDEGLKFWQGLSRNQKIMLSAVVVVAIVGVVVTLLWARTPSWQPLYSSLNQKDAGEIIAKLKEDKVDYKVSDSGKTLLVHSQNVHEIRMKLANEGLPKLGKDGWDLFNKNDFGGTKFLQDLKYQRALQGELAKTVTQIEGVEDARVHLVMPKEKLFTDEQEAATASVMLKLNEGTTLSTTQVRSISHLVSGSIPGLKEENIVITDSKGNVLFDRNMLDEYSSEKMQAKLNEEQQKLQKSVEGKIKSQVQSMLSKMVGPGNSVVRVASELDFDKEEIKSETYTPNVNNEEQVVRSEREIKEAGRGKNIVPGGVPGVSTNIPSYQEATGEGNTSFSREDKTKNYEVPKTISEHKKAPGKIKRLSVSVAIDKAVIDAAKVGPGQDLVKELRSLVVDAAGIDLSRGDSISVVSYPFNRTYEKEMVAAMKEEQQQEFWLKLAGFALGIVAIAALLGVLWFAFGRKEVEVEEEEPLLEIPTDSMGEKLQLTEPEEVRELTEMMEKRAVTVKSLSQMTQEDPANMARLLRAWMEEE